MVSSNIATILLLLSTSSSFMIRDGQAFVIPKSSVVVSRTELKASSVAETSAMMKEMQARINENEDAKLMMQALRGQGLNDDDSALAGLEMQLVNVNKGGDATDVLPYDYDPIALKQFFSKRPLAVVTRILQVMTTGSGLAMNILLDAIFKRVEKNPDLEIVRAAELRDTITKLGPFFIKIGQALSIRPDVLSPRSMVELQKLCDKVPSYDSRIAFATIEEELGKSVTELFSEITPEPVAAASLGQVYKAKLRKTGETVAVKVQRPGVLETVSLDLYMVREIGIFARKFPALVEKLDTGKFDILRVVYGLRSLTRSMSWFPSRFV